MKSFNQAILYMILTAIILPLQETIQAQNIGPEDKVISIFFGGGSYYVDEDQTQKLEEFVFDIECAVNQ